MEGQVACVERPYIFCQSHLTDQNIIWHLVLPCTPLPKRLYHSYILCRLYRKQIDVGLSTRFVRDYSTMTCRSRSCFDHHNYKL